MTEGRAIAVSHFLLCRACPVTDGGASEGRGGWSIAAPGADLSGRFHPPGPAPSAVPPPASPCSPSAQTPPPSQTSLVGQPCVLRNARFPGNPSACPPGRSPWISDAVSWEWVGQLAESRAWLSHAFSRKCVGLALSLTGHHPSDSMGQNLPGGRGPAKTPPPPGCPLGSGLGGSLVRSVRPPGRGACSLVSGGFSRVTAL